MKKRKLMVRIVALLMALLMGISVFALAFQLLARGADATTIAAIAATGDQGAPKWPIYAGLVAVLVIVVCVVVPKMMKKK